MNLPDRHEAHLIEVHLHSQQVLQGQFISVNRDTVRLPNGNQANREYVVHPGAVVIVAFLTVDRIILERQFRHPTGQVILEFPAGKLGPNELHFECGRRELLEETGYTAKKWAYVGFTYPAIGYSNEILHIYFACDLTLGKRNLDDGEFLEVIDMPVTDLLESCRTGQVTDAKTLACSLWLQNVYNGTWSLNWTS